MLDLFAVRPQPLKSTYHLKSVLPLKSQRSTSKVLMRHDSCGRRLQTQGGSAESSAAGSELRCRSLGAACAPTRGARVNRSGGSDSSWYSFRRGGFPPEQREAPESLDPGILTMGIVTTWNGCAWNTCVVSEGNDQSLRDNLNIFYWPISNGLELSCPLYSKFTDCHMIPLMSKIGLVELINNNN